MIDIKNKQDCCGCSACRNVCPRKCISMREDTEGFLYPFVDLGKCVDCKLCEIVCPILNKDKAKAENRKADCFAAQNKNDNLLKKVSSGGVFEAMARYTIAEDGIVFGAVFANDFKSVVHRHVNSLADLPMLFSSKYLQSDMGDSFVKIKKFLESGKKVLFSGTPCQVAAVADFLGKLSKSENYTAVEVICHGVPSPKFWRIFLENYVLKKLFNKLSKVKITAINFRDKRNGWLRFGTKIATSAGGESFFKIIKNPYMLAFHKNLSIRPSCYACAYKSANSRADITIGDYWGYCGSIPNMDKGVSAVVVRTEKGVQFWNKIKADLNIEHAEFSDIAQKNIALERSFIIPKERERFFAEIDSPRIFKTVSELTRIGIFKRIMGKLSCLKLKFFG